MEVKKRKVHKAVVVGLGNIGSQVIDLLASLAQIRQVLLIDHDRYEARNLGGTRIFRADVGKSKVNVQARYMRKLAPAHLKVEACCRPFEAMPVGIFRDSVILGCVDSRAARQHLNRVARVLGVPWIDAALDREGLVRSRTYFPGQGDCMECSWGPADYALLEQDYPCQFGHAVKTAPTNAPPELGAIAASLMVSQLRHLSEQGVGAVAAGRQWFLDLRNLSSWTASYDVNPDCLLDHQQWEITQLAGEAAVLTLGEALSLTVNARTDTALCVDGQTFVHRVRCLECGQMRRIHPRLSSRLGSHRCRSCNRSMVYTIQDVFPNLSCKIVDNRWLDRPLRMLGFEPHDVFSVVGKGGDPMHFEIGAAD